MIKSLLIVGYGSIGKRHARLARNLFPKAKIIVFRHKICSEIRNKYIDHCVTSLKDAIKLKLKAIKIASLELYDPLLLKSVAKSKKPIILSTGTSNINDINFALKI